MGRRHRVALTGPAGAAALGFEGFRDFDWHRAARRELCRDQRGAALPHRWMAPLASGTDPRRGSGPASGRWCSADGVLPMVSCRSGRCVDQTRCCRITSSSRSTGVRCMSPSSSGTTIARRTTTLSGTTECRSPRTRSSISPVAYSGRSKERSPRAAWHTARSARHPALRPRTLWDPLPCKVACLSAQAVCLAPTSLAAQGSMRRTRSSKAATPSSMSA